MVPALPRLDREVEIKRTARAERKVRPLAVKPRPVRTDEHVGGEKIALVARELGKAPRPRLLAHFDEIACVEPEIAARLQNSLERGEVDRVLALIVDDPAPVPFVVALGELERIEVVDPAPFHAEHRVAMAVAEDGHERRILDAL